MSVKILNVWIYSISPINLEPIMNCFYGHCEKINFRVKKSMPLEHFPENPVDCADKIERTNICPKSVSQAQRRIVDTSFFVYINAREYLQGV